MAHLEAAKNLVDAFEDKLRSRKRARREEKKSQPQPKRAKIEPGLQQQRRAPMPGSRMQEPTWWPELAVNSSLDINYCHNWTEEDISVWLNCFEFGSQYRQRFLDNAVDGRLL